MTVKLFRLRRFRVQGHFIPVHNYNIDYGAVGVKLEVNNDNINNNKKERDSHTFVAEAKKTEVIFDLISLYRFHCRMQLSSHTEFCYMKLRESIDSFIGKLNGIVY